MNTIKTVGPKLITTGMPGFLLSHPLFAEWVRVTGSVSVTLQTGVTPARLPLHTANIDKLAEAGKAAGASTLVVHWGPWNQTAREDAAEYFDESLGLAEDEAEYWSPLLDAALVASRRHGLSVVGVMDTELWSTTSDDPQQISLLYREAEQWWRNAFNDAPAYWYDLGGVRRQKRTDGAIAWEPNSRFPSNHVPSNAGRSSTSAYHLGDPAEFLWRLESAERHRARRIIAPLNRTQRWFAQGTDTLGSTQVTREAAPPDAAPFAELPAGVWLSLSSSSTDGRAWSADSWPVAYTRACGAVLGEWMRQPDAWIDRAILWMKRGDWTSLTALEHLGALCDGLA